MAGHTPATIRFTANFEANLGTIESWWQDQEFPPGYDRLLDEIGDTLIPNLERFPALGRPFLAHRPGSVEVLNRQQALGEQMARLGPESELREYLLDEYLVLYAIVGETVHLLAIKHHKQLSFDFPQHWR